MYPFAYVAKGFESRFRIAFASVRDDQRIAPLKTVRFFKPYKVFSHIAGQLGSVISVAQRIIPNLTLSEGRCERCISCRLPQSQLRMSNGKFIDVGC
jgi:hypothetical protein